MIMLMLTILVAVVMCMRSISWWAHHVGANFIVQAGQHLGRHSPDYVMMSVHVRVSAH